MSVAPTLPAPLSPVSPNLPSRQEAISPEVIRIGDLAIRRFDSLKLTLDEMTKNKKTLGDDKAMQSFIESMKRELSNYEMLKTWGGKKRKTQRR